ncbi:hydroxylysine kinase-like [Orussus abietinus]|uniref:hydroxylysine kinase-like n=1 Tax=Orussus abietinus TaxID=222816 RepID=UPI0006261CA5|nr:hydroxylysine kinase-like [Orussus abietinus]
MVDEIFPQFNYCVPIRMDTDKAKELVESVYGLKVGKITELNTYYDRVFHVLCSKNIKNPHVATINEAGYVLKVLNAADSKETDFVDAQNAIMNFLNRQGITCPSPVINLHNSYYSLETLENCDTEKHVVWLLIYQPGTILSAKNLTKDLLLELGRRAANLGNLLRGFSHPGYDAHDNLWMLTNLPKLKPFTLAVKDLQKRNLVCDVILDFENEVLANAGKLERGIIHGDFNLNNFVMDNTEEKITAIIDFGDSQKAFLIFELTIALAHVIHHTQDIKIGRFVIEGYESVKKLSDFERNILKTVVCARFVQCLVMGTYNQCNDPKYVFELQETGWVVLENLWLTERSQLLRMWGLSP